MTSSEGTPRRNRQGFVRPPTALLIPSPWSGDERDPVPWTYPGWAWIYKTTRQIRHRLSLHDWIGVRCSWCGKQRTVASRPKASEPICCGDPMIHNSFTGQYECSVAYLVLHDEGIDPYLVDPADLEPAQRAQHAHWMASRRPDGVTAPSPSAVEHGMNVSTGS
jgi:hypothetical protein